MQFHQLEYVLAVARCKGFTKLLKRLMFPSLLFHNKLVVLKELGIELFYRTTRSVQLTQRERLCKHTSRIMAK